MENVKETLLIFVWAIVFLWLFALFMHLVHIPYIQSNCWWTIPWLITFSIGLVAILSMLSMAITYLLFYILSLLNRRM